MRRLRSFNPSTGGWLLIQTLTVLGIAAIAAFGGAGPAGAAGSGNQQSAPGGNGHSSSAPGQQAKSTPSGQQGAQSQGDGRGQTQSQGSGGGANQQGPYDPNGVGLPSGNGNSDNNNGNRPCAGCVGSADTKNPPGQLPGGSDHNRGYECDENQGVGKTNPAHSGCGSTGNPPGVNTPPGGPPLTPGQTLGVVRAQESPASSQVRPAEGSDRREVAAASPGGERAEAPEAKPETKSEEQKVHRGGEALPFTGAPLLLLLAAGMVLQALGAGLRKTVPSDEGRGESQSSGQADQSADGQVLTPKP